MPRIGVNEQYFEMKFTWRKSYYYKNVFCKIKINYLYGELRHSSRHSSTLDTSWYTESTVFNILPDNRLNSHNLFGSSAQLFSKQSEAVTVMKRFVIMLPTSFQGIKYLCKIVNIYFENQLKRCRIFSPLKIFILYCYYGHNYLHLIGMNLSRPM